MITISQSNLDRYAKGQSEPNAFTTLVLARESGVPADEVLRIIAVEEAKKKQNPVIILDSLM
jgi:hypothetical protein